MKRLFASLNHTSDTTTKGVITMTDTRTRNYRFTTRFIACVLCIITVFSIGTVAMTGASAAVAGNITVVDYNSKTLRYSDDYFRHRLLNMIRT